MKPFFGRKSYRQLFFSLKLVKISFEKESSDPIVLDFKVLKSNKKFY
jgi:hypothetical protein